MFFLICVVQGRLMASLAGQAKAYNVRSVPDASCESVLSRSPLQATGRTSSRGAGHGLMARFVRHGNVLKLQDRFATRRPDRDCNVVYA